MAVKTIQIADKPTLDATKALLEDSEVGLAAIKQAASSGAVSGSAGGLQIEKCVDEPVSACVRVSKPPYTFNRGSAVVWNNEIHILGGNNGPTKHYKFNGSSWEEVSTLPYDFSCGTAVVLNNEIHILGSNFDTGKTKHYKYNGSSWESVSTLPYDFYNGSAVVWNNEIHILGGSNGSKKHYKFNGSSWEEVSTLPYDFIYGSAVVYDNKIQILGGINHYTNWYTYTGTSGWYSGGTLPYDFYNGSVVVLNSAIHILGSASDGNGIRHYKYYRNSWRNVSTLSPQLYYPNAAVIFDSKIYYIVDITLNIVTNDNRHIATMLPKGTHIMLSDNEDINYVANAEKVSSNIAEVSETGYVELLASMPEIYAAKGYLTFY